MSTSEPRWVCALCVIERGVKGSELDEWPLMTDPQLRLIIRTHMRHVHQIYVGDESDDA